MDILEYSGNVAEWDEYVRRSENATIYHQIGWKHVIEKTFGHKPYYLMAKEDGRIEGILPLILIKSRLFGSYLVSLPFIDYGGVCAENQQIAGSLIDYAIKTAQKEKVDSLEFRHLDKIDKSNLVTKESKVTFLLGLTDPTTLWEKSLHQNVRNKIRKGIKSNLTVKSGNNNGYIKDFYEVFSQNMRDLGTPVYSIEFFKNVVKEFPQQVKIFIVIKEGRAIGAKFVLFFKDTIFFSFASSLRNYFKVAPTSLLNWRAIEYACEKGYRFCDLGRSTWNTGPFNFKKKFGAEIKQLYWQYYLNKADTVPSINPSNKKYRIAIELWKRLPVPITKIIGPKIAKNLG